MPPITRSPLRLLFHLASAVVLGPLFAGAQPLPTPTFTNVTVHDPSIVRDGSQFYVFGSHLASARTPDLLHWTQISTSAAAGNPLVPNPAVEFREVLTWAQTNTFWAPDHIRLGDGRYYMYYCACRGDAPLSAMGLAVSDSIAGPYTHVVVLLRSGMNGTSEDGTPYNAAFHPNVVDPAVFFDQAGKLWMVYGSYSGGIFILEMDPATGRQKPGQGYGRKLIGKNHSRIEGPYILYSPETDYYYLFLSFGGLNAADGYNVRVGRSRNPDGPYVDAAGTDLTGVGGPNGTFFNDAAIAPHGVKLMGSYQFQHVAGEPQQTSRGYRSPGHNSAYRDPDTGKYFLVFHTRFVGRGEQHEVRVHQMFLNSDGWFVVAPHRYATETIAPITARQVPGNFKLINHGKAISGTVNLSTPIALNADGTVTGAATGTWQLSGGYDLTLTLGGVVHRGVFVLQWDDDNLVWVLGFTALSGDGVAVWGSKVAALNAVVAPAIAIPPTNQTIVPGETATLTSAATGAPAPELQWEKNGVAIGGANTAVLTIPNVAPADAGIYAIKAMSFAGAASAPAIVGLSSAAKVVGPGTEVLTDRVAGFSGNVYDQIRLEGPAASIRADELPPPEKNQITRMSYIDFDGDIVQVEFSGPGRLSLVLDDSSDPALPAKYNQQEHYMSGHAGIVITGANEFSNVSVFTVGRFTAFDPTGRFNMSQPITAENDPANNGSPLFVGHEATNYGGIADIAFIAIASTNGRFGGVRTANANYFASQGITGVYAPGVALDGPLFVGNITAFDSAQPTLVVGSVADARITGGDLWQDNGEPVEVSGIAQLRFTAGTDSHGRELLAKTNRAVLRQNGQDVTSQIVVNP